jgi:hypothetical protein
MHAAPVLDHIWPCQVCTRTPYVMHLRTQVDASYTLPPPEHRREACSAHPITSNSILWKLQ